MDDNNHKNYIDIMDQLGIKQMILQRPPGTSKTHDAKKIVRAALSELDDDGLKKEKGNRWDIVQFHPSYCYEDFVRGITVSTKNENVVYETVNKIFGRMCKLANDDDDKNNKYFLIIDEINRADIAAVFSELIYALEYREESISIPYEIDKKSEKNKNSEKDVDSKRERDSTLTVPEKLYIIGTMNTADRSIGTIDYAVRRRFLFFDLLPSEDVLKEFYSEDKDAAESIDAVAIDCLTRSMNS